MIANPRRSRKQRETSRSSSQKHLQTGLHKTLTTSMYHDELRRRDKRVYYVARHNNRIAGYGGAMIVHDEGHHLNRCPPKPKDSASLSASCLLSTDAYNTT